MSGRNLATIIILLLLSALPIPFVQAQTDKKTSVSLIYEAIAATNATLWLAEDARLFEKYGLDTKVVHARGAVPVQALVSGSVEFGAFSGSSAIAAVLAGSDLVFVAAKGNFRGHVVLGETRLADQNARGPQRQNHRRHPRRIGDPHDRAHRAEIGGTGGARREVPPSRRFAGIFRLSR